MLRQAERPRGGRAWILWVLLLLYVAAYVVVCSSRNYAGQLSWTLVTTTGVVAAIVVLIRCGAPRPRRWLLAAVLGALVYAAYLPLGAFGAMHVVGFVSVLLATAACCSAMNRYAAAMPHFWRHPTVRGILISLGLAIAVGVALGFFNLQLNHEPHDVKLTWQRFILPLSPAILEELANRAVLFALCLAIAGGALRSRSAKVASWLWMVVPHTLPHVSQQLATGDVAQGLTTAAFLALFFGVPFAVLQRVRDLSSAMVSHGIVDLMRFIVFGLPF